jgi:DNA repair exonuclease SbcCD ATPase subunit
MEIKMANNDQFKHGTKESFLLMQLADMREEIKALSYHIRSDIREVKSEIKGDITELREDLKELSAQRAEDVLNLSIELENLKTKSKMWGAGVATLISAGISLAAIYFQSHG